MIMIVMVNFGDDMIVFVNSSDVKFVGWCVLSKFDISFKSHFIA